MNSSLPHPQRSGQSTHQPRFGSICKKFFWNSYDHIGKLMLASLVSALLSLTLLGFPMALSGMLALSVGVAAYCDVELSDYFRAGARGYVRGAFLAGILVAGFLLLSSSVAFYSTDRLGVPLLSLLLLGLTLWLAIYFLAWLFILLPLAHFSDAPLRHLARDAAAMVLDNPGLCLAHVSCQFLIWAAGLASVVGAFLFSPALSAVLAATFTRELLGKYRPGLVREDEEVRTLADLFRPWQM